MNKDLYGKVIELPKEITEYLEKCFDMFPESNSSIEGHMRNKELREKGNITYQQLGRIKNWFDNYTGDGKDAPFILNGADYMRSWVNKTLGDMRNDDNQYKEIRKDFVPDDVNQQLVDDLGWLGDMVRPSKDHNNLTDELQITESLRRINEIMKKII